MSIYAIGDVQGCYDALMYLLDEISFDPANDKLWFAGDLVNRGHDSLRVLRFVHGLGKRAVTVLGNHDLHLLAISQGNRRDKGRNSTLEPIMMADDRNELLGWLRRRPLMHHCDKRGFSMVHAGLPPQWDVSTGLARAREVEQILRGSLFRSFMHHMYGDQPDIWSDKLKGWDRMRVIVNYFTRLRYCDIYGRMEMQEKGAPSKSNTTLKPWYAVPGHRAAGQKIVFGHWSTLGYQVVNNTYSLDTGCVWGGKLTALKIRKDGSTKVYQISCRKEGRI